jgi:membrane protease subunit HflK
MRADYLTYRTATSVSVKGLVIQAVMAGVLLAYAVLSRDHAGWSIGVFSGVGILAWLALCIVYDQHRRERIEAIEVDALAQTGGESSSVFQTQQDLRPAARRLANLYKLFMPVVSLLIAGLLVGLGSWLLYGVMNPAGGKKPLFTPDEFVPPRHTGWGIGLGVVIGVGGFVIARYAAGMAKQPVWANLRGGASYAVGSALLGLALAVAHVIDFIGPDAVLRYMQAAAPIFMILIGAETLLNFVLGIYRPRRAGEIPRAAFDSRLLGLLAAPDRIAKSISEAINYQLGFDVAGGWFYRLLSRSVLPLALAGVLIVWLLSGLTVVQPHQRAMVLRFGRPLERELGPGLHFKAPWPIDSIYVPEHFQRSASGRDVIVDRTVTGLRALDLGTKTKEFNEAILWTNEHPGDEVYQFVRASSGERPAASQAGESIEPGANVLRSNELVDLAMVSVEMPLHYVVSDVRLFDELASPEQRDDLLRSVAVREATRYFQRTHLDEVLGFGRERISQGLLEAIQAAFDGLNPGRDGKARGSGVRVVYVGISGVHPPRQAAPAFESPVQADARKIANIQNAEADAVATLTAVVGDSHLAGRIIEELDKRDRLVAQQASGASRAEDVAAQELKVQQLIVQAGGEAASTLARARAARWERHMEARAKVAINAGRAGMFNASPELYMATEYLRALRGVIEGSRLYVVESGGKNSWLQLDLQDKVTTSDVFGTTGETSE